MIATFISLLVGMFLGLFGAFVHRRFSTIDRFCDLVLTELTDLRRQADNFQGENGRPWWMQESQRRMWAYMKIVDWSTIVHGSRVEEACKEYIESELSAEAGHDIPVEMLVKIYRRAKESM